MTRRPLAVAFALVCAFATPAFARHQHANPRQGEVTQFCGDRYGSCSGTVAQNVARGPRHQRHATVASVRDANGNAVHGVGGLVTVPTAAGIDITVAREFAAPIQGFIADLVHTRGYVPKQIHCLNFSRSHVPGSLHFRGLACDFDQRGWGKTAGAMYRVADLAAKWGLRDGGEFRDWGHIDMGPHLRRHRSRVANLYEAVDGYQRKRGKIYR